LGRGIFFPREIGTASSIYVTVGSCYRWACSPVGSLERLEGSEYAYKNSTRTNVRFNRGTAL
jgi:hypothetical protein